MNDWKMPEWMEQYQDLFVQTGNKTVEEVVNSNKVHPEHLALDNGHPIAVASQIILLERLKRKGLLLNLPLK